MAEQAEASRQKALASLLLVDASQQEAKATEALAVEQRMERQLASRTQPEVRNIVHQLEDQ